MNGVRAIAGVMPPDNRPESVTTGPPTDGVA